jgi:hypothetical protein
MANRLVERLDGAAITIVDPRAEHLYQPGLSAGGGGAEAGQLHRQPDHRLVAPRGVLVAEAAAGIDPVAKSVTTAGGTRLDYDFLIVAPGLVLDHGAIDGFSLHGRQNGIGALYAGPDYAARTWGAARRLPRGRHGRVHPPGDRDEMRGRPAEAPFLSRTSPAGRPGRASTRCTTSHRRRRCSACRSWPRRCGCCSASAASPPHGPDADRRGPGIAQGGDLRAGTKDPPGSRPGPRRRSGGL